MSEDQVPPLPLHTQAPGTLLEEEEIIVLSKHPYPGNLGLIFDTAMPSRNLLNATKCFRDYTMIKPIFVKPGM